MQVLGHDENGCGCRDRLDEVDAGLDDGVAQVIRSAADARRPRQELGERVRPMGTLCRVEQSVRDGSGTAQHLVGGDFDDVHPHHPGATDGLANEMGLADARLALEEGRAVPSRRCQSSPPPSGWRAPRPARWWTAGGARPPRPGPARGAIVRRNPSAGIVRDRRSARSGASRRAGGPHRRPGPRHPPPALRSERPRSLRHRADPRSVRAPRPC